MRFYYAKEKLSKNKPLVRHELDQVYLQFDDQWRSPQFSDPRLVIELQKLSLRFFEREWVFLRNVNSVMEQQGPFSVYEMFQMLQNSTLVTDSLVWKKGFAQWTKISETEVFCELFGNKIETPMETSEELASILESIVEMQRVVEPKPDKNSGPDDENVVLLTP